VIVRHFGYYFLVALITVSVYEEINVSDFENSQLSKVIKGKAHRSRPISPPGAKQKKGNKQDELSGIWQYGDAGI
jgi:hypothetical protein